MKHPLESPSGPVPQQTLPLPRSFPSLFFRIDPFGYYGGCGEIIIILCYYKFKVDLSGAGIITPLTEFSVNLSEIS